MLPPYSILSASPMTITLVETMKVYGEDFLVFLIQRKVRYNNKTVQFSVHSQYHQALLITDFSWCHFLPPWSILVSTASKIFLKNHFDCVIPLTRNLWSLSIAHQIKSGSFSWFLSKHLWRNDCVPGSLPRYLRDRGLGLRTPGVLV